MGNPGVARRWLRNNPQLDGNPVGRGVAMHQMLVAASQEAASRAEGHWRTLRSRGLTRNQIAHFREKLSAWLRLPTEERARVIEVMTKADLPESAIDEMRRAALLHSWAEHVRTTNATISTLEVRITEQRTSMARLDELRAIADRAPAEDKELAELEGQQGELADNIGALARRSMELQHTLVREILVALVDGAEELVKDMIREGIFGEDDTRDYRGLADAFQTHDGS